MKIIKYNEYVSQKLNETNNVNLLSNFTSGYLINIKRWFEEGSLKDYELDVYEPQKSSTLGVIPDNSNNITLDFLDIDFKYKLEISIALEDFMEDNQNPLCTINLKKLTLDGDYIDKWFSIEKEDNDSMEDLEIEDGKIRIGDMNGDVLIQIISSMQDGTQALGTNVNTEEENEEERPDLEGDF